MTNETDTRLREYGSHLSDLFLRSKAENTVKKYRYGFAAWRKWCNDYDSITSVPASAYHVSLYISSLVQEGASVSKIDQAVYSIAWAHQIKGFDSPCDSVLVKNIVEGARKQLSKPIIKKESITPEILHQLVSEFGHNNNLYDKRIVTMCLIGYAGFLRFSELAHIRAYDLSFQSACVSIFIEKSKTDKYREGAWVHIAKTDSITCPVNMLQSYIDAAHIDMDSDEFIFRQVSFCKKSNSYVLRKSGKLSYTRVRELILEKLKLLGLDVSKFGVHSLRLGGATSAASAGVVDRL